jgi:hypothetical protein
LLDLALVRAGVASLKNKDAWEDRGHAIRFGDADAADVV